MEFSIRRAEKFSRGELLLRSFFGFIYIAIPHSVMLMLYGMWGAILSFISFWIILFTGRYPESYFEYQVKLMRYSLRVNASIMNLIDGYPSFGLDGSHEDITFEVEYPENLSRGTLLVKFFFGIFYVIIPHAFVLYFLGIAAAFLSIIAWFAVMFTGEYPEGMFNYQVGVLRWQLRMNLYMNYMTDKYPPFSLS